MKKNICFFYFFFLPLFLFSQLPADTTLPHAGDTSLVQAADTLLRPSADSLSQVTTKIPPPTALEVYCSKMDSLFSCNIVLNSKGTPAAAAIRERNKNGTDIIFYSLLVTTLLLAFLRFFYTRYFNSLFQVFFNTSLRQSQLTDQLLQAKLASGFFNLFFVMTGGVYIFVLLNYYKIGAGINALLLIITCVLVLAAIYFIKFCILKFTGWLTGFKDVANTYLFVIFLINKIISVLLLPFVIVIAFSASDFKISAVVISILLVSFMFFLRFLRSYGLLRSKIKVSWSHFFVFIVGVEILPLLLIYRGVVILLHKNI